MGISGRLSSSPGANSLGTIGIGVSGANKLPVTFGKNALSVSGELLGLLDPNENGVSGQLPTSLGANEVGVFDELPTSLDVWPGSLPSRYDAANPDGREPGKHTYHRWDLRRMQRVRNYLMRMM